MANDPRDEELDFEIIPNANITSSAAPSAAAKHSCGLPESWQGLGEPPETDNNGAAAREAMTGSSSADEARRRPKRVGILGPGRGQRARKTLSPRTQPRGRPRTAPPTRLPDNDYGL